MNFGIIFKSARLRSRNIKVGITTSSFSNIRKLELEALAFGLYGVKLLLIFVSNRWIIYIGFVFCTKMS